MAIGDCIKNALDGGEISAEEAERLEGLYDAMVRQRARGGAVSAPLVAREDLARLLKAETAEMKRQLALSIKAIRDRDADLSTPVQLNGKVDVVASAYRILEHHGDAPFSSIEGRKGALVGQAHAYMENLLYEFRRGAVLGDVTRHNKARLVDVVREAFGEGTGDKAAKELAGAWQQTHEWLRRRFNDAGGAIGKLEKWGLPQYHDARALRKIGLDGWKRAIAPQLDIARMRHPLSGDSVVAAELDEILNEVFLSITTEGWFDREPSRAPFGRGALANQRAEYRFLIFRNADAWLDYQKNFGRGDPFAAMMGHVNLMARDIAAMEVLGPNPNATIEWIKQSIMKEARLAEAGKEARWNGKPQSAANRARRAQGRIDRMWSAIRGDLETPVDSKVADVMGGTRSIITSSVLGSASITALSDIGFQKSWRLFNGLPVWRTFGDIVRQFSPSNKRQAVQAGLILDNARNIFNRQARYVGTLEGPQWASYLADRTLTWSGLTPWTQAGQHSAGMAVLAETANQLHLPFDEVPVNFRDMFSRWGFSASDWQAMGKAGRYSEDGAVFLRPRELAKIDQGLADRFLEMVLQEREFAVPTGSISAKTLIVADKPGTAIGELTRSFAQFKMFGVHFAILQTQRIAMAIAAGGDMRARGAQYAGALLVSTVLLGALSVQLKQVAAGRKLRDTNNAAFWTAAFLQGGSLGIYGDYLFADVNRYGGSLANTLGGPAVQRLSDLWTLTGGNVQQLAQGKKTNFGREAIRFSKGVTPVLPSLWYTRTAYERVFLDQLQFLVDPEAKKAFRRKEQWWKRNFDQEFYWRPGQTLPGAGQAR